jgi:Protein of unknown function (DUF2442)
MHMTRHPRFRDGRTEETRSRHSSPIPVIEAVEFKGDYLMFRLSDGNAVAMHLLFCPWLSDASDLQRRSWKLVAGGQEIRWPGIGKKISVKGLLSLRVERYAINLLDA